MIERTGAQPIEQGARTSGVGSETIGCSARSRATALRHLSRWRMRAESRAGATVLISGAHELSRTGLVAAAEAQLRDSDWRVARVRCRPADPSHHPLVQLLDRIGDGSASQRIEQLKTRLRPTRAPGLGDLSGRRLSAGRHHASDQRLDIYQALAEILIEVSQPQPVALIIDDIGVGDPSTRAAVRFLARVLTATPELTEAQETQQHFRGLLLLSSDLTNPLSADDSHWTEGVSLRRLGADRPDAQAVREQLASDAVVRRVMQLTGGVPARIETLLSQLDRPVPLWETLDVDERAACAALTVYGRPVGCETLRALTRLPHGALTAVLDRLARRGLVETVSHAGAHGGSGRSGEPLLAFACLDTQRELYAALDADQRRSLHGAIGDLLRGSSAELESCAAHLLRGPRGHEACPGGADRGSAAGGRRLLRTRRRALPSRPRPVHG